MLFSLNGKNTAALMITASLWNMLWILSKNTVVVIMQQIPEQALKNHPDDTKWVADVFMPTAVEYGCKIIYFIIDENNSLKDELEGQESDSSDKIEFRYIYNLNEIEK